MNEPGIAPRQPYGETIPPLLNLSQHYRDAAAQVLRCVRQGTYCALIGPRFSGKSELMTTVKQTLMQDPTWLCVDLDLRNVEAPTQTDFFANLMGTMARVMKERTGCESAWQDDSSASSVVFRAFLLNCVSDLKRDLVLMIEHLEAMPNDLVQALLTSLRAAFMDQQSDEHRLVVVVSGALSLARRTVGESSPLRGIADRILVGELSEEESAALVAGQVSAAQIRISSAAGTWLLRAGRGDPALITWLCERCIRIAQEAHLTQVTANTVKRVMREFLWYEASAYAPIQEAIALIEDDPDLLRCVLLLLEQRSVPVRKLPLPMSPDLDPLYLTGMVRKVPVQDQPDGDHYQLRNEIYRQCLAGYFDPGRVGHLLTISGRWDTAIDYLQASIRQGNNQYRSDLLAATVNSMYAAEDVQHAARYLARGLSAAFGIREASIWHATAEQDSLSVVGHFGPGLHQSTSVDAKSRHRLGEALPSRWQGLATIATAADTLEARAFRQRDSLRGQEMQGCVRRAIPLLIPGPKAIGVVTVLDELQSRLPALQREGDLQLVGYLNQAARAIHEVATRQQQLLRIAELEMERTAQELRVARDIQVSLLPEQCPALPDWEICTDWRVAREVGGDFYDFVPLGREHIGLVIADVSDKGIPAALFMSLARTLVRTSANEIRSPARALSRVNELLMTDSRSGMFLTLFYAVLNWRTGHLVYANAGHNPPILWRPKRSVRVEPSPGPHAAQEADVVWLTARGIVLGAIEDIELEEREATVEPGDILVLYTDGVTEPINEHKEEFGEERLIQVISDNWDKPCGDIVGSIRSALAEFVGDQPQFDDYTLVSLKRRQN